MLVYQRVHFLPYKLNHKHKLLVNALYMMYMDPMDVALDWKIDSIGPVV